MMFRRVQADEESESDWDEATPATTPRGGEVNTAVSQSPTTSVTVDSPLPQNQSIVSRYEVQSHPSDSSHTIIEPHPPQSFHTPRKPRPSHNTTVQIDIHGSPTPPRRPLPPITYQPPPLLQASPRYTPRRLSEDQGTQTTPLSPSTGTNPVYLEEERQSPGEYCPSDTGHSARLIGKNKSEILKFTGVDDDSAKQLLPSFGPPPYSSMGDIGERTEELSQRCTQETISCMKIVSDVIINFTLGLVHLCLYHIARKLCCGLARIVSDSVVKSGVDVSFNDLFWPFCSCCYQLSKATVLVLSPYVELLGTLFNYVANMCKAYRLVEIHYNNTTTKPINV